MNKHDKIKKISLLLLVGGVLAYLISRLLLIYTLCGMNNYPTHLEALLCDFLYSKIGSQIITLSYWGGISMMVIAGLMWLKVVIEEHTLKKVKI